MLEDIIVTSLILELTGIRLVSPYAVLKGAVCDTFKREVRPHRYTLKHNETNICIQSFGLAFTMRQRYAFVSWPNWLAPVP